MKYMERIYSESEIKLIKEIFDMSIKQIYDEDLKKIIIDCKEMFLEGQKTLKEIERLNNIINKVIADIEDVRDKNNYYDDYKVDNSILTYWIDLLKGVDKE